MEEFTIEIDISYAKTALGVSDQTAAFVLPQDRGVVLAKARWLLPKCEGKLQRTLFRQLLTKTLTRASSSYVGMQVRAGSQRFNCVYFGHLANAMRSELGTVQRVLPGPGPRRKEDSKSKNCHRTLAIML